MAELVVVAFDTENDADRVLTELNKLRREHLIDLGDAVVAIRDANGKVHIKQSINMVGHGATYGTLTGGLWGTLVGLLFMNPLAGFAVGSLVGAGTGALSGSLVDFGIDDDLIREMGETLQPGTSALFLLIRKVQPEKVLSELKGFGGRVMRSSLSPDQEARLQAALQKVDASQSAAQPA